MPTIYDVISAPALAAYYESNPRLEAPYLFSAFFPSKKQLSLDLSYIKGAKGAVKPLSLSGYDAKAIPLAREGFDKLETEMPYFKNMMVLNEKQKRELVNLLAANNQAAVETVVNEIFDDQGTLLDNAELTLEMMRAQALTTGKVTFANNGQKVDFDYEVPADNKVGPTVAWSDAANADPIADLTRWADNAEIRHGVRPTYAVMNASTFALIKKAKAVKDAIYVLGNGNVTVSTAKVKEHIKDETGLTVLIYNKGYKKDNAFVKFVPDNKISLFPDMAMGNTWFSPTPAEIDLQGSNEIESFNLFDNGIALYTKKQADPVTVQTLVAMIAMVSMERANDLILADVSVAGGEDNL